MAELGAEGVDWVRGNREVDGPQNGEVISGKDRGYIRSDPELIGGMLRKSIADGDVKIAEGSADEIIKNRLTDLTAYYGVTLLAPTHFQQIPYEGYHSLVVINNIRDLSGGDGIAIAQAKHTEQDPIEDEVAVAGQEEHGGKGKELRIIFEGPIVMRSDVLEAQTFSPIDLGPQQPRIKIIFSDKDTGRKFDFIYGRDGAVELSERVHGGSKRVSAEEATAYLLNNLPQVMLQDGTPQITGGEATVDKQALYHGIDTIRQQRNNPALQDYIAEKRAKGNYDGVVYVPPNFFENNHREGELLSVEYPESFIPSDALILPKGRIDRIITELGIDPSEEEKATVDYILQAIPGGTVGAIVLTEEQGDTVPDSVTLPTTLFDKAGLYFLQHREVIQTAMEKYRMICTQLGKNLEGSLHNSATLRSFQIGLNQGLLGDASYYGNASEDKFKEDIRIGLYGVFSSQNLPDFFDGAVGDLYQSLLSVGNSLRENVYSDEERKLVAANPL